MPLPTVSQASLGIRAINWTGLPRRFLNPGELEVLVALVRSVEAERIARDGVAALRMVEFGCHDGRTAKALMRELPAITEYVGVDVLPGYKFEKAVQAREVPPVPGALMLDDPRFILHVTPRGTFDLNDKILGPADIVFIDGDHSRRAVAWDTALAAEIVKPGGMIIWHDYHTLGTVDVQPLLDSFAEHGSPIVHVEGTWIAFERIPL